MVPRLDFIAITDRSYLGFHLVYCVMSFRCSWNKLVLGSVTITKIPLKLFYKREDISRMLG